MCRAETEGLEVSNGQAARESRPVIMSLQRDATRPHRIGRTSRTAECGQIRHLSASHHVPESIRFSTTTASIKKNHHIQYRDKLDSNAGARTCSSRRDTSAVTPIIQVTWPVQEQWLPNGIRGSHHHLSRDKNFLNQVIRNIPSVH